MTRRKPEQRGTVSQAPAYARAKDITAERDVLVAELKRLQDRLGSSARFTTQARDLLTRAWSRTDWNGRQGLVQAARWLVHLESADA